MKKILKFIGNEIAQTVGIVGDLFMSTLNIISSPLNRLHGILPEAYRQKKEDDEEHEVHDVIHNKSYPEHDEEIELLCKDAGINTKKNFQASFVGNSNDYSGVSKLVFSSEKQQDGLETDIQKNYIILGKGLASDKAGFLFVAAHEIRHTSIRHKTNHLDELKDILNYPLAIALFATTNMYTLGGVLYPVTHKIVDTANLLVSHGYPFALGVAVANTMITRIKEHDADIFSYNKTGVLPHTALSKIEIVKEHSGVMGALRKEIARFINSIGTGYPTDMERDIACLVFGKKPKMSFTERLENERVSNTPTINKLT